MKLPTGTYSCLVLLGFLLGSPGTSASRKTRPPRAVRPPARPHPQPKPWARGVGPEERARAQQLFQEGLKAFARGDSAEALALFQQAVRHWDHPAIRYNMAVCLVDLDRPVEAYQNIEKALRFGSGPFSPSEFRQIQNYKKLLEGRLAWLVVECREPGAQVFVDGDLLFTGPGRATKVVKAGRHQVVARKKGKVPATVDLSVLPGTKKKVRLVLLSYAEKVNLTRRWAPWVPWTVVGSGAAALALGAILYWRAAADIKSYDDWFRSEEHLAGCTAPGGGCYEEEIPSSVRRLPGQSRAEQWTGVAFFATGGALVVSGLVLAILNRPRALPRQRQLLAAPHLLLAPGPEGVQATLSLGF